MSYKVAFVSLGCAKNLVNTQQMMALCRDAGVTVTGEPEGADVAVLNTCGFIDSAMSEAIQNILELAELKKEGKLGKLLQQHRVQPTGMAAEAGGVIGPGLPVKGSARARFTVVHRTFSLLNFIH